MPLTCTLADLGPTPACDVAVLGAGAAGLSAAVFAALDGARVTLIERTEYLGGSSALSAATTWVPNTRHAAAVGAEDSLDKALGFLDRAVGNRAPRALREAFLRAGPAAIHRLEDDAGVPFRARPFHPDYLHELEGSADRGRALEPLPYDGRALGRDLALIRPPIPEFTILGGMMVDRDDIAHLLKIGRSPRSTLYALRRIGAYYLTKARHGRDTRLLMGNALIGRLAEAARRLGVQVLMQAEVTDIPAPDGVVSGVVVRQGGHEARIDVSGGVILASGGFARHPQRRAEMLPDPAPEWSPAAPGHTGALHDIALRLGARYGEGAAQPCFWAPCSHRRRADGSMAVFPHFVFDRAKPGIISVGRDGRRFVNESTSYHLFVAAMYAADAGGSHIPAFLIADAPALRKYGMGMIRPGGADIRPFLADGYLTEGRTPAELAAKIGVDPAGLADSIARMNNFAEAGEDADFARGTTVYERANGDPAHGPNPTLGRLEEAPYYAVRLWPGDIGSATGLTTDAAARVLGGGDAPIPGLYACGNDMQSVMGGVYPGPGITIGPGITFGYIAARDAAARAAGQRQAAQ